MKKIMFNDRYGLTQAVLEGKKTMTRRIIPYIEIPWARRVRVTPPVSGFEYDVLFFRDEGISYYPAPAKYQPRYERDEEVAVAQCYKDIDYRGIVAYEDASDIQPGMVRPICAQESAGWTNKMFVRADLMEETIRITDIRLQRLQNISDEDCIKKGIMEGEFMNTWDRFYFDEWGDVANHITFNRPQDAFHNLIDRISGKGTWESNPWVYVYEFELV